MYFSLFFVEKNMLGKILNFCIFAFILKANQLHGDKLDEKIDIESHEFVSLVNILKALGFTTKCIDNSLDNCKNTYTNVNDSADNLNFDVNGLFPLFKINPDCLLKNALGCNEKIGKYEETKVKIIEAFRPRNCLDILNFGDKRSGVKVIFPWKHSPDLSEEVYCDQETDEGGWTVIQRRKAIEIRESFYRTWIEYRLGFGNKESEFWLGNDLINELTSSRLHQLRIDLMDFENESRWAKYQSFHVDDLNNNYKLSVGRYSGTAGDSLATHNGRMFTTHDRDNDDTAGNCAQESKGAWWYRACHYSNLNGYPYQGNHNSSADGINWYHWKQYHYSMASTVMMIKPAFN